jgi:hypothetical protein
LALLQSFLFSSDLEHFEHLNELLKRLKNAGLKLKPSKCDLIKDEILYLGHLVGKTGVKPNPRILETVKNWRKTNTVKEVQQFLGLISSFIRSHLDGLSLRPAFLSRLRSSLRCSKCSRSELNIIKFLGLCNYYRQFIKGFSEVAAPLTHLTRKDVDFQWSDSVQQCFEKLKLALCTAPILAYPKPDGIFIVSVSIHLASCP